MAGPLEHVQEAGIAFWRLVDDKRLTRFRPRALGSACCRRRRDINADKKCIRLCCLACLHSHLHVLQAGPLHLLGVLLLQAAREAQLVMRGQRHRIRSSLLTTWSRGGHSSLRGLGRRCHMVLTTTQELR